MRKWILAFALAAVGLSATEVQAQSGLFRKRPPNAPMANLTTNTYPPKFWHGGQTLPVFQAARGSLYWPYDAHSQPRAPFLGPYYAPPIGGNFPVQPYFPAAAGPMPPQGMPGQPPVFNVPIKE